MINEKNHQYWNILKGVSILSIVIGHTYSKLVPFVYLYHLAVFFFITGYLYNEEKYGDNPSIYFLQKIKKNWIKYSLCSCFLVLIHNLLLKLNMIIAEPYNLSMMLKCILNGVLFNDSETLGGALWFIPLLIIASTIFGIIIYVSRKYSNSKLVMKHVLIITLSILSGLFGIYLARQNMHVVYHAQTCFLVIPFFTAGYYLRYLFKDLKKVLNIWLFILSLITLSFIVLKTNYRIELSVNAIGSRSILFYPISLMGIYFCLYLSKLINKVKYLNKYFDIIGNYSFEIMAFHFLVIKVIDFIYASINGINTYNTFPSAFPELWPLYIVLGCTIPAFTFYFFDCMIKKHSKKEKESNKNKVKTNKKVNERNRKIK